VEIYTAPLPEYCRSRFLGIVFFNLVSVRIYGKEARSEKREQVITAEISHGANQISPVSSNDIRNSTIKAPTQRFPEEDPSGRIMRDAAVRPAFCATTSALPSGRVDRR
jgi:hypothetical protein